MFFSQFIVANYLTPNSLSSSYVGRVKNKNKFQVKPKDLLFGDQTQLIPDFVYCLIWPNLMISIKLNSSNNSSK